MDWDDVIYLVLLFFSIGFGYYYRKIEDLETRKLTGTFVGLGIIFSVSGIHILHIFIFTFINILIILLLNKRVCHLVSFVFSFLYLIFFRTTEYFGIPYPPAHTNLIIMILTLKLVGLAFEMNTTHTRKAKDKGEHTLEQLAFEESTDIEPNALDIVHYAFNYIGVLTGPYFSYRSFWDSLHSRFFDYANCNGATLEKLFHVPLYSILFFTASYFWPFSYALSDEFYMERSWLYRLWFCIPCFFIFRMRIYIGIVLSECVCTAAGLGAYPIQVLPKPGAGPTTNFTVLKEIHENPEKASKQYYNFETIHNISPYGADFCTTFREGMKHWNMCIQYWLAVNIYKRFPSKQFRTFVTMFISAIWHGVYIGHYFTICGAPFYLAVEDFYVKLFLKDKNGQYVKMWEWIIWMFKMFAFSYLSVAFHLLTVEKVMHYYNSIYHAGGILGVILFVIGMYLTKTRKRVI